MEQNLQCPDTQQIKDFATSSTLQITPTTVKIPNQDHTVMNPLRYFIQRNNKDVELVGYTIPHPAEKCAVLKIQYKKNGNIKETVIKGLSDIEDLCLRLLDGIDAENKWYMCNECWLENSD